MSRCSTRCYAPAAHTTLGLARLDSASASPFYFPLRVLETAPPPLADDLALLGDRGRPPHADSPLPPETAERARKRSGARDRGRASPKAAERAARREQRQRHSHVALSDARNAVYCIAVIMTRYTITYAHLSRVPSLRHLFLSYLAIAIMELRCTMVLKICKQLLKRDGS